MTAQINDKCKQRRSRLDAEARQRVEGPPPDPAALRMGALQKDTRPLKGHASPQRSTRLGVRAGLTTALFLCCFKWTCVR